MLEVENIGTEMRLHSRADKAEERISMLKHLTIEPPDTKEQRENPGKGRIE